MEWSWSLHCGAAQRKALASHRACAAQCLAPAAIKTIAHPSVADRLNAWARFSIYYMLNGGTAHFRIFLGESIGHSIRCFPPVRPDRAAVCSYFTLVQHPYGEPTLLSALRRHCRLPAHLMQPACFIAICQYPAVGP